MNLKTDIQLGFPLAVEPWEFVVVKSTLKADSLQQWLTPDRTAPHPKLANIADVGAGTVLDFNKKTHATGKSFHFYHVSEVTSGRLPSRWAGLSDTAACTLALAQPQELSDDAPIILISCRCDFTPEIRPSGALLLPVSDSVNDKANGQALFQKWQSATQKKEPVVGLVLFESDVYILLEELQSRRLKKPSVIPIADLDVMQLLTLPRSWPALISVGEYDLVQLAERLGIDGTPFKPTLPRREREENGRSSRTTRPFSWPSSSVRPLTPSEKAHKTIFSLHTLKVLSISGAIIGIGAIGTQRFLSNKIDEWHRVKPAIVADLSSPTHDLSSPVDLRQSPPAEDLALPRITDDLVQPDPPSPRIAPGTVRTIGGTDMVFIAADTMPSGLKPFWLDRTEVTTEAFEKCIDSGACHFDTPPASTQVGSRCNRGVEKARHPINCVNYHEASRYCAQMGKYLPSTQQWDFAARGNRILAFPWGDTMLATDALCWHRRAGSCPVDQYPGDISPFGVLGMGANVGEWTSTKFYPDPELSARVFRGWSWGTDKVSEFFQSHGLPAEKSQNNLGFRCAKDVSGLD